MGLKKKFLSQAETVGSNSPMMDLLNEKKNKKDKKKKKLMTASDTYMNESFDDDAFEGKKKKDKKNKKGTTDLSMHNSYEEFSEASEGKKKKKNKKLQESTLDNLDIHDNSVLMEPEGNLKKDKKKKKKSAKLDVSFVKEEEEQSQELDLNESSYSDSSPKKKNKGKKVSDGESSFTLKSSKDGKAFDSPGRVLSSKSYKKRQQDAAEDLVSPSHKKKKGEAVPSKTLLEAEELNENDKEIDSEVEKNINGTDETASYMNADSLWTSEEEVYLLNRIRESLTPNDAAVPYKKSLSNIGWDDIAFDNRSADDCKEKLNKLISRLIKQKSLPVLLEEAKNYCKGEKNIKIPRDRFVQLFFKKKKADPAYSAAQNKDIMREANLAWSAMAQEEREEYEVQYRNELKKHRKLLDLPPELPRMPVSIYYDIQVKKLRTKSTELRKKLIKTFNEMDFEDKIPYIHESVKELHKYHKTLEEYKKSHPEWQEERRLRLCNSLFQEYIEYLGMPKYKNNGFTAYLAHIKTKGTLDHITGKDRLKHATSKYHALSEEEKAKFAKEAKTNQNCYVENYNGWLEKQDEAIVLLLQKYYTPKTIVGLKSGPFSNVVEMSMTKPRFTEEPNKPPTALKLFQLKFERRFSERYTVKEAMKNDCLAAWKVLSPKDKGVYLKRAKYNLELYKESVLEYVRGLGQSASVYLGFKRADFFRFFKEDIFEKDFPNEEYPIFVSPKKKDKTLTNKVASDKKLSRKKVKVEDSDESESEDGFNDSSLAKGSRKLGNKSPNATASSEDEAEDDDGIKEQEENEVSHSWNIGKASAEKEKADFNSNVNSSEEDDEDDDDDDEDEEEDDDDDEEMESD